MRIGFFDSGVGGITVLYEALKQLPQEDYIYYADTDHVPYGTKSKEDVLRYALEAVEFMAAEGIKALVVACNTATSIAINTLRQRYDFPILGMEPAVKPAVEKCCSKRILVMATPLTLKEEKYQNLVTRLDHDHLVDGLALPELVTYAEEFQFDPDEIKTYLRSRLNGYDLDQYGTVVLGCTHFPYFKGILKQLFPEGTNIIDGSAGTICYLKTVLGQRNLLSSSGQGNILFYSSGRREPLNSRYTHYLDYLHHSKI
ncbi:glutamate racemase [Dehalobacter sp. DCM]|uniref:glutamate racemase n=1 Tax=Dehalobacter sp. DCM TaxID=2907827 RepID=UPI003081F33C|nr:glutamate racemase [Dehalobacter sp. DCM]